MFATPNVLSQIAESRLRRTIPPVGHPPVPIEETSETPRTGATHRMAALWPASLA